MLIGLAAVVAVGSLGLVALIRGPAQMRGDSQATTAPQPVVDEIVEELWAALPQGTRTDEAAVERLIQQISHGDPFAELPFSVTAWNDAAVDEDEAACNRGRMGRDLLRWLSVRAPSRDVIGGILGAPDEVHVDEDGSTLEYYLGFCSGFRIDPDYLVLRFDESGSLESSGIEQR